MPPVARANESKESQGGGQGVARRARRCPASRPPPPPLARAARPRVYAEKAGRGERADWLIPVVLNKPGFFGPSSIAVFIIRYVTVIVPFLRCVSMDLHGPTPVRNARMDVFFLRFLCSPSLSSPFLLVLLLALLFFAAAESVALAIITPGVYVLSI